YIGKERDEESGLYQMGARYYAPWTCKFLSVDPLAVKLAHQSSYCYADCNPIMLKDPSGMQTQSNGGADKNDVQKTNELHLLKIDGEALKKSKSAQPMDGQVAPENNSALKTKQQQEVNTNIKMQPQVSKKTELKAAAATASVKHLQEIKQGLPPVKKEDSLLGITLNKMETSLTTVKDKLINTVEKVDDFGVKLGGYGGKLVESTIKPPVDKLDDYMKSASQVGANVEAKVDFNKYSVGGKLGFYSTSETNGGFEASANYTIKANIKKTKEEGWSSTLTTFKFKPSVKINFYVSRGEANKDSALWDVSNSTIVEGKAFAGPLEISTDSKKVDQFSIGLLKSKQDFGAEFGVKNQTKWFGYSGTFQIGH
ncbi:MAG: RHS repeat-associated core domain-containing protein, partial [Chitinophagales bacterium]|nr:RHS repeat-associated core domain-containing protein [Chitinophagales bacterium]